MNALRYSFVALVFFGCGAPKEHMLTDRDYAPVRSPEQVRLFAGDTQREVIEIAVVDSFASRDRSTATRQSQLRNLRERAAEVGAGAVVDVRVLKEKHRGMVADPSVPVPAWKQGNSTLYFVRGTAVRFAEDDQTLEWEEEQAGLTAPAAPSASNETAGIPAQEDEGEEAASSLSSRPGY